MKGHKDAASEVAEVSVAVGDALDHFDRVITALGKAVGVWAIEGRR